MNYILFDGPSRNTLRPFTLTRPVADIRVGILTLREKWELFLGAKLSTATKGYLSSKYPMVAMDDNIAIDASFFPSKPLVDAIETLRERQALFSGKTLIAFRTKTPEHAFCSDNYDAIAFKEPVSSITSPLDILSKNATALHNDFNLITRGRTSQVVSSSNRVIAPEHIFVEEGASLEFATLNASKGPIYIGKNATIMEGALIRGSFALCEGATVKLGAKIYGPTTVGPYSKVGGEINNAVLFAHSNKAHDGFLGHSVLGEWCNLGADTNTSNLKNDYSNVRLWDYETEGFKKTESQFCGLMMGDHSKCGINTMFNTGTVVGVYANIFGSGFPRCFIPSFSWGGSSGFTTYSLKKAFDVAIRVTQRRGIAFTEQDAAILEHVFDSTEKFRASY